MESQENKQELNQILMQFGPIHGNVEKQEIHTTSQKTEDTPKPAQEMQVQASSPVYLNKETRGNKIDLIRVINVLYYLGFFCGRGGSQISKKEVFITIGKALNMDLSNYDSDLSRSLSDSTKLEKHLSIFERMKGKMEEVFNNYGG